MINVLGNFSKIALDAGEHGHIIYDPDEYGLAFMPQKGPKPTGTSASQMMSFPELLNLLTPPKGGGGFEGVTASRRFTYPESLVFVLYFEGCVHGPYCLLFVWRRCSWVMFVFWKMCSSVFL